MTRNLARIATVVFHPFAIPLYATAVLLFADTVYSLYPMKVKLYLLWVVALYSLVIPLLCTALLRRLDRTGMLRLDRRRATVVPLLIGAICYMLCAVTLLKIPSLLLFRKIAVAAMLCEVFCTFAVPLWRVSMHLTALGAATALLVILNIVGVVSMFWALLAVIAVAGITASSRLYLGRNNGRQVLTGFLGGFVICSAAMLYL